MIRQPSSLQSVVENRLCTGCGACAAMAPDMIRMRETDDENRRPHMVRPLPRAVEKGILAACPGSGSTCGGTDSSRPDSTAPASRLEAAWGPVLEVWEGHAADADIRFRGSSGGATTALALFAMERLGFHGTLHVKARKDAPTLNEAAISTDRAMLMEGTGSRYAPASVCDKLPAVTDAPAPCVVVGKPCDIAGTRRLARLDKALNTRVGLTISIFCAGTPSHRGTRKLLNKLSPWRPGVLERLQYRGNGWPGDMRATWRLNDGTVSEQATSYADGWNTILQKTRQWRCHVCEDHTGEQADISIGDPWQNAPTDGDHGSSLIVARTERGRRILHAARMSGYLVMEKRDPEVLFAAQPNLFATKGAVWGRSLALRLSGLAAPAMTRAGLHCWLALPLKTKVTSIAGTFKRIWTKRLHRRKTLAWLGGSRQS